MLRIGLTGSIACGKSFIGKLFKVYGVRIVDSDIIAREVVAPGSTALDEIASKFGPEFILPDGNLNRSLMRELVFADKSKLEILNSILHPAIRKRTDELCALCEQGKPFDQSYLDIIKQQRKLKSEAAAANTKDASADMSTSAPSGSAAYASSKVTSSNDGSAACTVGSTGVVANGVGCNDGTDRSTGEGARSYDSAIGVDDSKTEAGMRAIIEPLDKRYVLKEGHRPPYILVDIPLLFENKLESFVDRILVIDATRETQIKRILARDGCTLETAQNIIDKQLSREYKLKHADDVIQTDTLCIEEKRAHVLKLHLRYLQLAG